MFTSLDKLKARYPYTARYRIDIARGVALDTIVLSLRDYHTLLTDHLDHVLGQCAALKEIETLIFEITRGLTA